MHGSGVFGAMDNLKGKWILLLQSPTLCRISSCPKYRCGIGLLAKDRCGVGFGSEGWGLGRRGCEGGSKGGTE